MANLPPVSTTPAANFATSFTSVIDTGGKQLDYYQAADTLKWTWRQKIIYMLTLLSKSVPKIIKIFLIEDFFICHRCCWHRWSTLSCEYLCEFSKKFETVLMGYSGAGGKLIHEKNQKQKISWHCPFKIMFSNSKNCCVVCTVLYISDITITMPHPPTHTPLSPCMPYMVSIFYTTRICI